MNHLHNLLYIIEKIMKEAVAKLNEFAAAPVDYLLMLCSSSLLSEAVTSSILFTETS